jgi:hypothetical protein
VVVPCSLTCNPTRTPPNQVSYLKGSSMVSFTLGPTPKIDFRCSAATIHLQWLQRKNNIFEQLLNSIPNSCSSQCPRAYIYRLGAQISVRQNIDGRRPDRQLCDRIFRKIPLRNLSCLRAASRRDGTSSKRSHVRCK